ncbi:hypothetical protein T484DRAFT_1632485, partial [Baffinella frigidus]
NPKPQTPNPKPQTPNPKPQTPNPKPQTPNPKPQTPNPKPQTPNPTPHTPHPKLQTPNSKPQTTNHQPHPTVGNVNGERDSGRDHLQLTNPLTLTAWANRRFSIFDFKGAEVRIRLQWLQFPLKSRNRKPSICPSREGWWKSTSDGTVDVIICS